MSGPSSTQLQLQQEQADFYAQGIAQSNTTFGEQQDLLKQMEAVYEPILNRGPNQEGFSAAEKANLDSQAIEGTAENYEGAARAVNESIAASGGDNPIAGGGGEAEQLKAEVAASSAQEESREETQIEQADYAQGFKEFEDATSALSTVSGQFNPVAFENAATSSGNAAETTAQQINQEENSWMAPVLGAVGGLAGAVVSENPKGIFS